MNIEILPKDLVNQIAAGEVVERPAHMVKELVENSIDAGATELEIEFDQGGKYLKISDNGIGIKKDQIALALARHATSKITKIDDLWQLKSFGFRGEALASIAAVSDFKIISKNKSDESAHVIHSEFGALSELEACGGSIGTTIIIKNLFNNVPARLKFLKTEATESTQIKLALKAMAMSHPEVTFRVKTKNDLLFYWPKTKSRKERVESILEQEGMFSIEGEYEDSKIEIIYSSPNKTVRSRRQIWSFVQERWVQDKTIAASIVDSYRSLLMHGEFPYAVAFVKTPSNDIDVNIHPTKSEVKYKNSSNIYKLVYRTLRPELEKAPWLKPLLSDADTNQEDVFTLKMDKSTSSAPKQTNLSFGDTALDKTQFKQKHFVSNKTDNSVVNNTKEQLSSLSVENYSSAPTVAAATVSSSEVKTKWSDLQVLGQADLTYIITQKDGAMILVDQHAAHERVMYEKLMSDFEQQNFEVQNLLIPEIINLTEAQVNILLKHQTDIKDLGIEIDAMGSDSLAIRSLPSVVKERAIKSALEKMADELINKGGSVVLKNIIGDVFASMACHSVVRAGQSMSMEEMTSLLKQMDEFPLSSFCPHGRPVFVEYPFTKIEKDFGRIV